MGCDIHLNLEYRHPSGGFEPIIANYFDASRDYRLFAALADVRNDENRPCRYPVRGLPPDVSTWIAQEFFTEILPDDADDTRKQLARYWLYESEVNLSRLTQEARVHEYGESRYLSNPDWHHASWLTHSEVVEALHAFELTIPQMPAEFQMVMDFMVAIDSRFGRDASRIVFWFDN